jgi:hypothetical protein
MPASSRWALARAVVMLPAAAFLLTSCASSGVRSGNVAMAAWTDLLPGNAGAWRGYRQDRLPEGWRFDASTGELTRAAGGGDIVTRDQYEDFELELEWKVGPGGNSGVFYRATEATDIIYMNARPRRPSDSRAKCCRWMALRAERGSSASRSACHVASSWRSRRLTFR